MQFASDKTKTEKVENQKNCRYCKYSRTRLDMGGFSGLECLHLAAIRDMPKTSIIVGNGNDYSYVAKRCKEYVSKNELSVDFPD